VVKLFSAGDHIVCGEGVYGGTYRLFDQVIARLGIEFTFVDSRRPGRDPRGGAAEHAAVHVETPTNPMMRLTDLAAAAEIAHEAGAWLLVDNTFASPYNQRPLELGRRPGLHSTTKYLNGHSDMVGG
jgi:cystathionine gamma-lyase